MARAQRLGHGRLVDQPAAGAVDQPRARLHPRDALGREDVGGLLGLRQVQRHEVGAGQHLVEVLDPLDAEGLRPVRREERIVGDHLHPQPHGARRDDRADVAAADQAERLAGDLDPHEARLLPLAGLGRGVGSRDLPGAGEHHGDGVLGGGDRVAEGRVHHHDALGRGGRDIDVVDADAGAADDAQVAGLVDQVGGHLGRRADGEAVVVADDLGELRLVLAELRLEVDLDAAVAEDLHGGVGKLVGNENLGHGICLRGRARRPAGCQERKRDQAARGGGEGPVEPRRQRLDVGGLDRGAAPDPQARRRVAVAGDVVGDALGLEELGHPLDEVALRRLVERRRPPDRRS